MDTEEDGHSSNESQLKFESRIDDLMHDRSSESVMFHRQRVES